MTDFKSIIKKIMSKGCDYSDIRIHISDKAETINVLNGDLHHYEVSDNCGYGIRVLYNGAWGFASSSDFNDINDIAEKAVNNAKISSLLKKNKIELSPKKVYSDSYNSPVGIDPFEVSLNEKIKFLLSIDSKLKDTKFEMSNVYAYFNKRRILFFDSEGSEIEKNLLDCEGDMSINGRDKTGQMQVRSFLMYQDPEGNSGWNNFLSENQFTDNAIRIKNELLSLFDAPECQNEISDIILLPEMMALQTHETIGHAFELDRILGYELSYAGGSHITLDKFGSFEFGSKKLTVRADGTIKNSCGSTGFDDDGVKSENVILIDKGIPVNAISSRQTITEANKKAGKEIFKKSSGNNRASDFNRIPIERMNNINIDSGNDGTFEDIIKGCDNGMMVETPRSWSIGSKRENYHFATQIGWKIKNGKILYPVRNVTFSGDSVRFWQSLDKIGDSSTLQMQQVYVCGKGLPNQIMRLGHNVPVCLFKNINIGG